MKKVLLIARAKGEKTIQKTANFAKAIQDLIPEATIENCEITELAYELSPEFIKIYHPVKGFDLKNFDLVIIRNVGTCYEEAQAIAVYCKRHGIEYTDKYLNRPLLDSKMSTSFMLWVNGVKNTPHFLYASKNEMMRRFKDFGPKAVVKDNKGSKGRLNFVVKNEQEIENIFNENPETTFLMQEMIPNDSDLRVLVMNNKTRLVIKRSSQGKSHLNNTSQGGKAEIIDLTKIDKDVLEMSEKAAKITKLDVAGVDVLTNSETGTKYILEVNNAPQISSGSFTNDKALVYADMIKELLNDR